MNIRLIASDLDDTLLDEHSRLTERTLRALDAAREVLLYCEERNIHAQVYVNDVCYSETLDDVSGGISFTPFLNKKWCSHCNDMVMYRIIFENGEAREECLECHNPL